MRGIADTIARMAAAAQNREGQSHGGQYRDAMQEASEPKLTALNDFGTNPGALDAYVYVPTGLGVGAPLVVVLHGCTQSAAAYDVGSGWSALADKYGFALLYPQQRRGNNVNLCFNWFEGEDTRRDAGEPYSIRQMIGTLEDRLSIDPTRVFVTGLSAGGAMAAVMLATYPEVFAGGAVIAGVAYGVADGMVQAFDRMRGHGLSDGTALAAKVRAAAPNGGSWPRLSIWHGSSDATVASQNATALGAQWRALHGLSDRPNRVESVDGTPRRVWHGSTGDVLVEEYLVSGMGHGTPLKTTGPGAYGRTGPYMLDVGISSTHRIAQFWGIVPEAQVAPRATAACIETSSLPALSKPKRLYGQTASKPPQADAPTGVAKVIEDALRSAGLMK